MHCLLLLLSKFSFYDVTTQHIWFSLFYPAWGSLKSLHIGGENSYQIQKLLAIISSYTLSAHFSLYLLGLCDCIMLDHLILVSDVPAGF